MLYYGFWVCFPSWDTYMLRFLLPFVLFYWFGTYVLYIFVIIKNFCIQWSDDVASFFQEKVRELHRKACEVFDLIMDQVRLDLHFFTASYLDGHLNYQSSGICRSVFGTTMVARSMLWWMTWKRPLMMQIYRWIRMCVFAPLNSFLNTKMSYLFYS